MKTSFKIFISKYFVKESCIGSLELSSIPTSSMPFSFDTSRNFYLSNLLEIKIQKTEYDGEYFVNKSLIHVDDNSNYPTIELYIEKNNGAQDTFLYLKGTASHIPNEMFIPVNVIGDSNKKIRLAILPKTNLDFLLIEGICYQCDKVIHKQNGEVEINAKNGIDIDYFRKNCVF